MLLLGVQLDNRVGRGTSHREKPSRRGTNVRPECAFGLGVSRYLGDIQEESSGGQLS